MRSFHSCCRRTLPLLPFTVSNWLSSCRNASSIADSEAVLKKRYIDRAMSKNRDRKVIGFSRESSEPVDDLMAALLKNYPEKSRTHVFDFNLLNGVLSEHLIRYKWPKITALEPCHLGNMYSVVDLHVPPFIDYQFAFDNLFAFTRENDAVVRSAVKGAAEQSGVPQSIISAKLNESVSFNILSSNLEGSGSLNFVAVGCFSPTNLTIRKLHRYGHLQLYNVEAKFINSLDILAYFPNDTAQIIMSDTLTKNRCKFLLDLFCDIEFIASHSMDCFEGFFKPSHIPPKNMKLLHIKPRPVNDTFSILGLSKEDTLGLYTFYNQCAYTPAKQFRHCFQQLSFGQLISLLSDNQLNSCLKDSSLKEFVDIYLTLSQDSAFEIFLNSWWRQNHGEHERMSSNCKRRKRVQHEKKPKDESSLGSYGKPWGSSEETAQSFESSGCFAI